MKLPFKTTAPSPPTEPSLADTNFLAHYTGANASMSFSEIEPGIRQAIGKFILPFLGREFYNELVEIFETNSTSTEPIATAIELLQDCAAYYTAYHILPERNAFLASMGTVQNTPNGGSQPASQWSWKAKRWSAIENGDKFLDLLLKHLEDSIKNGSPEFDTWKNSDFYKRRGSTFFRNTQDLDELLNIQGSRRSFISLVKFCRFVEAETISNILCTDLLEELNTQLESDSLSDANKKLVPIIREAVANLGLVEALPHHRIAIDGDGFRVVSSTDQFDDRRNQTNNVHENAIIALGNAALKKGQNAISKLVTFLRNNKADYPLWADSPCFTSGESERVAHRIVPPSNGIGAVGIF